MAAQGRRFDETVEEQQDSEMRRADANVHAGVPYGLVSIRSAFVVAMERIHSREAASLAGVAPSVPSPSMERVHAMAVVRVLENGVAHVADAWHGVVVDAACEDERVVGVAAEGGTGMRPTVHSPSIAAS